MLKIIGGEYRSRILHTPPTGESTRPYTNRVKESVFNLLRGWFDDANVVDLFAGVGTMGLEAASRGAKRVLMVESSRAMVELAKKNINELGCDDRVEVMHADALAATWMSRAPQPVDVMFIDPPYDMMRRAEMRQRVMSQIERCRDLLAEKSFVVLRSPIEPDEAEFTLAGYDGPEVHQYSNEMRVLLYALGSLQPEPVH